MRTDIVYFSCFRVCKLRQPSPFGTPCDYLLGSMAVNAEEQFLTVSYNRTAALDIFL